MFSLSFDNMLDRHLLIVLGDRGVPVFKSIHSNGDYLEKIGESSVSNPKSRYKQYMVIDSSNIFSMVSQHYSFDEALSSIIRDMMLENTDSLKSRF